MIHLMLKYIPYRISLNKVIIILNQANEHVEKNNELKLMELQSIRKKIWKMNKYYPNFDHWIFIISFKVWKNPEITIWTESNSQLAYIFQGHNYWKREWERVSGKYKLHTIYQCMYTILAGRGLIKVGFFQFG